jgi:hypothetical protein
MAGPRFDVGALQELACAKVFARGGSEYYPSAD